MANPQPTPFVRFSKELFEAFYRNPPATVAACRLWLWVLRWTWADFSKQETDDKTLREISDEVSMSRGSVCRELQSLVRCRRLKVGKAGGYAIQKDYDLWREDPQKRGAHFGNTAQQVPLFTPVYNLGITGKLASNGETPAASNGEAKRCATVKFTVSPSETPIRSKNTVENISATVPQVSIGKKDTPRQRAALGDPELPPDEHPNFRQLPFKLRDELTEQWREVSEKRRKKNACARNCGRDRASTTWGYCRPCTVCAECGAQPNGTTKFTVVQRQILCTSCRGDSG